MKIDRQLAFHTRRDTWLEVNLAAFEDNVGKIKQSLPEGMGMMAVIKADAYGHGAPMLAPILESFGVDLLGVASVDEALQLRAATTLPILVLGTSPDWALQFATEENFQVTIFSGQHLDVLKACYEQNQQPTQVHIKIDTGMNRIGLTASEAVDFIERCLSLPYIEVKGIFTHLAAATNPVPTAQQLSQWCSIIDALGPQADAIEWKHVASSSAISEAVLRYSNMVRPGLGLFGYGPLAQKLGLKPLMHVKARIVHLQTIHPGEGVSYEHQYINTTQQPQVIATLPLGYADGIPRGLSNKIEFIYKDHLVPQVGNICMDQCMVNVSSVTNPQVGDVITLLGSKGPHAIWLDKWAQTLQTIEYELMTGLRVRLPRSYVRQ